MADEACVWTWQDDWDCPYWETACGEAFVFTDGGPAENRCKFCPYCGKKLAEVIPPVEDDDEEREVTT